jgi:hypothetical protein
MKRCSFAMSISFMFLFSAAMASTIDPKDKDWLLAGVWVDKPYVAEQNCYGLLLLFPDHKFAMAECLENVKLCQKMETIGTWKYRGKVLKLDVTKRAKRTGKWNDDEDQGKGCFYEGIKPVVKTFSPPRVKSFSCILPPGAPDLNAEYNSDCWEMSLNGKRYWKFNAPIEEYCGFISLAAEICRE